MKKILVFDYEDGFVVKAKNESENLLKIDKEELKLEGKSIYNNLFKDLTEIPEYEVQNIFVDGEDKSLNRKAKVIYNTLNEIISNVCLQLEAENLFYSDDIKEVINS